MSSDFNEQARLEALRDTGLLDTPVEDRFDRFTRLASFVAGTPIALISLIDVNRQWFKSCIGLDVSETPRNVAFCDYAIRSADVMVVLDATKDERFAQNPLVTGDPLIRFYAGAPLVLSSGHAIGTLCVIGKEPRAAFSAQEQQALADLAQLAVNEIEHREVATAREVAVNELQHRLGNMFSQVIGLITLTVGPDQTTEQYVSELRGRLQSLNLVHRRLAEGSWEADSLAALIEAAILPAIGDRRARMLIVGPEIKVTARSAMAITLGLFELATNSLKHGALGTPGEGASITWRIAGETFELTWEEPNARGLAAAGSTAGFGSTLLRRVVPAELGGTATYDILPDVVRYSVSTLLANIS